MTNLPTPLIPLRKGGGIFGKITTRKEGGIFGGITTRKGGGIFGLPRKNCIFSRNDEVVDCHDLLKGKFCNDDLEAIRRLSRFAIRKDLQNAFFCK